MALVNSRFLVVISLLTIICLFTVPAEAQYSGGTGEPNDPYQIATAEDLMLLGETPEDFDRHFILTADIDLSDLNFGRAVIAPDTNDVDYYYQGTPFSGHLDGQGHRIQQLHIEGRSNLGLFGQLGHGAQIMNLSLVDADVVGTESNIGLLVGFNYGTITNCYSIGTITGEEHHIGGLVGFNRGSITTSYSTASVSGRVDAGGLVGRNYGSITTSYSTGSVSGDGRIGGFVGSNDRYGHIMTCYSTGAVTGKNNFGGLVGENDWNGIITSSIWDMETSGLTFSDGGFGLTTSEMMDPYMLGLIGFSNNLNWILDVGRDYPRLAWEGTDGQVIPESIIDWLDGQGTAAKPYRIDTADQLILLSRTSVLWDKHFILGVDIDMDSDLQDREVFPQVVIKVFSGVFDGNDHTISHLTIRGGSYLGLFGELASGASISNLGLEAVDVRGMGNYIGGLVGKNLGGYISNCFSNGIVNGKAYVGGLVGWNEGNITTSCSIGTVTGNQNYIGGLVGLNSSAGNIAASYSASTVTGDAATGGLVGQNGGSIAACYSNCVVKGNRRRVGFGGLVGRNWGGITTSYSSGSVAEADNPGGLVGHNGGIITSSVWDMETSGLSESAGGVGLTTSEMTSLYMIGLNGFAEDPNWVLNTGLDYPRLAWEGTAGQVIPVPEIDWMDGQGTPEESYIIDKTDQLIFLRRASGLWDKHFILCADIDLDPNLQDREVFSQAPIQVFSGIFDGNGHVISNLTISGDSYLGLFGQLRSGAIVSNLGLEAVDVNGTGDDIGGLVGANSGNITKSYSIGTVNGGGWSVGGLVGFNNGSINTCYSMGTITAAGSVGGLVGRNSANVTTSYSVGTVIGEEFVGGIVGYGGHGVLNSVWDMETSGLTVSGGGFGLTTAEMMDPYMLSLNGFAGNPNWILDAGRDYPRLAWEGTAGQIIPELIIDWLDGQGTAAEPYRINMADQLITLRKVSAIWDKHFILGADIDLDPKLQGREIFSETVILFFSGVFDGNDHTISHLTIWGDSNLGLFGQLHPGATISNLALEAVDIKGTGTNVGGLTGRNYGTITSSYVTGSIIGGNSVGGLAGFNSWESSISKCYNTSTIIGNTSVGGLVGWNSGNITMSYNNGTILGTSWIGGLVGLNENCITSSYNTGSVIGEESPGGLVGLNDGGGISSSYSAGSVSGNKGGGLVGNVGPSGVSASFWDIETSGLTGNVDDIDLFGIGLTTAEMQTADTFLDAGWDFVDEVENGTEDIWWMSEGQDYPRLWWEAEGN